MSETPWPVLACLLEGKTQETLYFLTQSLGDMGKLSWEWGLPNQPCLSLLTLFLPFNYSGVEEGKEVTGSPLPQGLLNFWQILRTEPQEQCMTLIQNSFSLRAFLTHQKLFTRNGEQFTLLYNPISESI